MADAAGLPLPPAKGTGKGKGFPPPPAKGTGKGKGFPPPVAARGRVSHHQSQQESRLPPAELRAPANVSRLRIHHGRANMFVNREGTLWDAADPWAKTAAQRFPAWRVNEDRFRELWGPPPVHPAATAAPSRAQGQTSVLEGQTLSKVEIMTKGFKLTAETVQRYLDGDFELLPRAAKEVLGRQFVHYAEASGAALRGFVERFGEAGLSAGERVLWAMTSTPLGCARARLLALEASLTDELEDLQQKVNQPHAVLEHLRDSDPVKMLFQVVLFVRNVTAQEEWSLFPLANLAESIKWERARQAGSTRVVERDSEFYRTHYPSTLRLVAEMVMDLQESHMELQLMRARAVSKAVGLEPLRKLIWRFLDDMGPGIFGAFEVLRGCDSRLFDEGVAEQADELRFGLRRHQGGDLRLLRQHFEAAVLTTPQRQRHAWLERLEEMSRMITEGIATTDFCQSRYIESMEEALRLAAMPRAVRNNDLFDHAKEAMIYLHRLGDVVRKEVEHLRFLQRGRLRMAEMQAVLAGGAAVHLPARAWELVNTREEVLCTTIDADIIRALRAQAAVEAAAAAAAMSGAEGRVAPDSAGEAPTVQAQPAPQSRVLLKTKPLIIDLAHSGPEGKYLRDPVTGKWGRRLDGVDGTSDSVFSDGRAIQ